MIVIASIAILFIESFIITPPIKTMLEYFYHGRFRFLSPTKGGRTISHFNMSLKVRLRSFVGDTIVERGRMQTKEVLL